PTPSAAASSTMAGSPALRSTVATHPTASTESPAPARVSTASRYNPSGSAPRLDPTPSTNDLGRRRTSPPPGSPARSVPTPPPDLDGDHRRVGRLVDQSRGDGPHGDAGGADEHEAVDVGPPLPHGGHRPAGLVLEGKPPGQGRPRLGDGADDDPAVAVGH